MDKKDKQIRQEVEIVSITRKRLSENICPDTKRFKKSEIERNHIKTVLANEITKMAQIK